MEVKIREETAADVAVIEALTRTAFLSASHSSLTEHLIASALRRAGQLAVSLVAQHGEAVIGHVGVSPVAITDGTQGWFGLGPLAVLPQRQRRGIGTQLMHAALERLRGHQAGGCVVLGDPAFYARFGFRPDPDLLLPGVPAEYFQAIAFGRRRPRGTVTYHEAFAITDPGRP